MEIESMQFDLSRAIQMVTGEMSNRSNNLPQFELIELAKGLDESSVGLLTEVVKGRGVEAEIHVVSPGSIVKILLKDSMIAHLSTSAAADEGVVENLSLSFSRITFEYGVVDERGRPTNLQRVTYDLARGFAE